MTQLEVYTNRLYLRSISLEDAEAIFRYRSDAEANKYQGWIPGTFENVHDFIRNKVEPTINIPNTWHQLVLVRIGDQALIGDIGIHFLEDDMEVEIGFTLDKKQQGKGYATEAVQGVIDYLFKKLNKKTIFASIDPKNSASIKLVERLGFKLNTELKNSIHPNGEWVDDLIYTLSAKKWTHRNV
jgi:RimJ/RimL family protein N-acetyltransferase